MKDFITITVLAAAVALVPAGVVATGANKPVAQAEAHKAVAVSQVAEVPQVVAGETQLSFEAPTVGTVAAPVVEKTEEPGPAVEEQLVAAPAGNAEFVKSVTPVAAPKPAVAEVAPAAPVCQEDEPCWNCKVDGNKVCGPVVGGPGYMEPDYPVVPLPNDNCKSSTECVAPVYKKGMDSTVGRVKPVDCANLQPGQAWAGVGLVCGTPTPAPTQTFEPGKVYTCVYTDPANVGCP